MLPDHPSNHARRRVVIDYRGAAAYAFWTYLFDTLAFWGGLTLIDGYGL